MVVVKPGFGHKHGVLTFEAEIPMIYRIRTTRFFRINRID